ncbi:MAG: hydantoinase/oxoprolinase family protein [Candidatus Altarchaeum sp.]|nr:hydantoinase/oxoprolinase family protein [Candidatus Altarchaeum sp.]
MKIIAMDIGGANIKIFNGTEYKQYYFPLWKKKNKFMSFLQQLTERADLNADVYAITMTAELCDCFKDRREGVKFILNALKEILDKKNFVTSLRSGTFKNRLKVLSNDTNFKLIDIDKAMKFPYNVASANFIATAEYISKFEKNAIIIDIGSTTTDIIPIKDGKILAHRTDFERLKNNELVYTGVFRTNLISISNKIKFKGKILKISAEYFANTGDVYSVLGKISDGEYKTETADGKGKSTIECMRRIARTVCCDFQNSKNFENIGAKRTYFQNEVLKTSERKRGGLIEDEDKIYGIADMNERKSKISKDEIIKIAEYFKNEQIKKINKAIERQEKKYNIKKRFILGAGKFLYNDLNALLTYADLSAVTALYFLTSDLIKIRKIIS